MPKSKPPYTPEFRRRMVELVRASPKSSPRSSSRLRSRFATGWCKRIAMTGVALTA